MKNTELYTVLIIILLAFSGFFSNFNLTGNTSHISTFNPYILLTTGACPTGYSLAGSTTLSYSTTGTTSASYAWKALKAQPTGAQDYQAIITGPTTTGTVNYCKPTGSTRLQVTSGYKACALPYDATPLVGNYGVVGTNIVAQDFSQAINPLGPGAIFTACTTYMKTIGAPCSANNQCASNMCDFTIGKCVILDRYVLMMDATAPSSATTGPYPLRQPDFTKSCPTGYENNGIVANFQVTNFFVGGPGSGVKNWFYTLICSKTPVSTCFDGIKNQDETDVDCGGSICAKCAANKVCSTANDCVAGSSCTLVQDIISGAVTTCSVDRDVLGSSAVCSPATGPTGTRSIGTYQEYNGKGKWYNPYLISLSNTIDAELVNCKPYNSCALPACTKGTLQATIPEYNEYETVKWGICSENSIVVRSCTQSFKGRQCTTTSPGLQYTKLTTYIIDIVNSDDILRTFRYYDLYLGPKSASKYVCSSTTITPSGTCTDGIKNGLETDIDCGGSNCQRCLINQGCSVNNDCETYTSCANNVCVASNKPRLFLTTSACPTGYSLVRTTSVQSAWGAKVPKATAMSDFYVLTQNKPAQINYCAPSGSNLIIIGGGSCPTNYAATSNNAIENTITTSVPYSQAYGLCTVSVNNIMEVITKDVSALSTVSYSPLDLSKTNCPVGYELAGVVSREVYFPYNNVVSSNWNLHYIGFCVSQTAIVIPTCSDGVKNQDESGIDCGGLTCTARCATGVSCSTNSDCITGNLCNNNICTVPTTTTTATATCSDGIKNQNEADIDCGGSCVACSYGKTCGANSDCASGLVCDSGICRYTNGQSCTTSIECASGLTCSNGLCSGTPAAPSVPSAPSGGGGGGGGGGGSASRGRAGAGAFVCGNGRIDLGEQCDDGNIFNDDGCSKECIIEYCGDEIVQYGLKEQCDPPDSITCSLGCSLISQIPSPVVTTPTYEEPISYIPEYVPVVQQPSRLPKIIGTIITIVALAAGISYLLKKKAKSQQQPFSLPLKYSRGSR